MKRTIIRQTGVAAAALALSVSLAACGSDDSSDDAGGNDDTTSQESEGGDMGGSEGEEGTDESATDAGAETFGPGCSAIPTQGAGSFDGMATEPVATAASSNPLLKTLVSAVGEADLVDTLNSAEALTVFAPTDDAFAKIPKKDMNAVMADKQMLSKILTHHVVEGQLGPDEVAGEHETLAGDKITVEGSGEDYTAEDATVLCGNIPTANATVYVIDTVMMPK